MLFPFSIYANTVINGNDFTIYNRTKEEIYNKWIVGKIDDSVNIFNREASYVSPYVAGITTDEYLGEVVDNLNYYRYLVGVPEILEKTTNDNELQTAEVIQTLYVLEEEKLTHYLYRDFEKPDDMDQAFWDIGANANHNIISYGRPDEPNFYFFDESIFDPVYPQSGHRMALLSSDVIREDYGIGVYTIYGRSTLDKNNYNKMTNDFAAYPSPGYFPREDFADISDWDIFLNIDKFKDLTDSEKLDVKVTITDLETNKEYIRSLKDGNLVFDNRCYGLPCDHYNNILNILQPDKDGEYYDGSYKVYVSNLKNKKDELVDLEYTVNFYNKLEGTASNVVDTDLLIDKIYIDEEYDEDFIREMLSDSQITLLLDNGETFEYTPSEYDISYYGNAGYGTSVYHAIPKTNNLPTYIKDNNNMIRSTYITIQCNTLPSTYKMGYSTDTYNKKLNDSVKLQIDSVRYDFSGYVAYMWISDENGLLENNDKYKIETKNYEKYYLNINDLTREDDGDYYFVLLLFDDDNRYVYISKPITLNITIPVESIMFSSDSITLNKGESLKLNPVVNPGDYNSGLIWTTSNYSVVSVDDDGNITAKESGSAIITVSSGSVYTKITINVPSYSKGDINMDGEIGLVDVIKLLKIYLGVDNGTSEELEIGDMNSDGEINLIDVISLLRIYLGVE